MRENHQLKRVSKRRNGQAASEKYCYLCGNYLSGCSSYGVFDPIGESWERVYFCPEHGYLLDASPEDLLNHEQQILFSGGFINELFDRS